MRVKKGIGFGLEMMGNDGDLGVVCQALGGGGGFLGRDDGFVWGGGLMEGRRGWVE